MHLPFTMRLPSWLLAASILFLTTTQSGFAQTAAEYGAMGGQQKSEVITRTIQNAFEHLASDENLDGTKKTPDTLAKHHRMRNLSTALFKKLASESSDAKEALGLKQFRQHLETAAKEAPDWTVWNVLAVYVRAQYEQFYEKTTEQRRRELDAKNDRDQVASFGVAIYAQGIEDLADRYRALAKYHREKAAEEKKKMDAARADQKKY